MQLYASLTSPYARKIRVLVHEQRLDCPLVTDDPRADDSHARRTNPLGKVPVLVLADGTVLYDSPVIVEYLDSLASDPWLPPAGALRWAILRDQALADGMMDAIVRRYQERMRPVAQQSEMVLAWEADRLARALDALESAVTGRTYLHGDRFGLADAAVGVALAYIDLRDPSPWRSTRPALAAWLETLTARPSFVATAPPGV